MTVMTSAASGLAAIPWILVWSWRSKDDRRSCTVRLGLDLVVDDFSSSSMAVAALEDVDVDVRKSP